MPRSSASNRGDVALSSISVIFPRADRILAPSRQTESHWRFPVKPAPIAIVVLITVAAQSLLGGPVEDALAKIDPLGRPKSVQSGKRTEYGIWFENGEWHIRATGQSGKKQHFRGYVRLEGGKIKEGKFNHL